MWIFGYGSLVWKVDFPYVKKVIGYIKGYERKFWQASIDHRGVPEKPGRVVTLVPAEDPEVKVWGAAYKIHRMDVERVLQQLDLREVMGYEKIPISFHPVPNHPQNILEPSSPFDYNNHHQSINLIKESLENGHSTITNSDSISFPSTTITSNSDKKIKMLPHNDFSSTADSDNDSNSEDIMQGRHYTVMMYYGSAENEHYIGPASLDSMANQIFESVGPSGNNKDYLYNLAKAMRQISEDALDSHLAELEAAVRDLDLKYSMKSPGTPMEL